MMGRSRMKLTSILLFLFVFSEVSAQTDYSILSEVVLESDGAEGMETYALIESKFGVGCIESPDLYSVNHPAEKHIVEATDSVTGNHFVFKIHKNDDLDRDTGKTDRQRNEIKTYANSDNKVKGFKGETLRFHWFFKLQEGFTISKNFSHFFQLKAVDGDDDSQPIATLSGSINSDRPEFEIIHNSGNGTSDKQLVHANWDLANTGQWMEIEAIATFADDGYLKITVSDLNRNVILSVEKNHIDMWRTGSTFVRPKWGIYRSLNSSSYLSDEEETACFANYSIQKIAFPEQTKVEDLDSNSLFKAFPNPASNQIKVEFGHPFTGKLRLINELGNLVHEYSCTQKFQIELSVGHLPKGIYYLQKGDNTIRVVTQ